MNYGQIIKRSDNSYVITKNGLPYHVPNEGEYAEEWVEVDAYASEHPEMVELEPEYVEPEISIEVIKEAKLNQLKQARDAEELSPISYSGYMWDFDEKAQMRINGAIIALGEEGTITWTSADNEEIKKVNADDLRGVVGAAAIRSNELHIKYRELKAEVENATTVEEVEAINW